MDAHPHQPPHGTLEYAAPPPRSVGMVGLALLGASLLVLAVVWLIALMVSMNLVPISQALWVTPATMIGVTLVHLAGVGVFAAGCRRAVRVQLLLTGSGVLLAVALLVLPWFYYAFLVGALGAPIYWPYMAWLVLAGRAASLVMIWHMWRLRTAAGEALAAIPGARHDQFVRASLWLCLTGSLIVAMMATHMVMISALYGAFGLALVVQIVAMATVLILPLTATICGMILIQAAGLVPQR